MGGPKNDDLANKEVMEALRNNGANVTANSKAAYQRNTIVALSIVGLNCIIIKTIISTQIASNFCYTIVTLIVTAF